MSSSKASVLWPSAVQLLPQSMEWTKLIWPILSLPILSQKPLSVQQPIALHSYSAVWLYLPGAIRQPGQQFSSVGEQPTTQWPAVAVIFNLFIKWKQENCSWYAGPTACQWSGHHQPVLLTWWGTSIIATSQSCHKCQKKGPDSKRPPKDDHAKTPQTGVTMLMAGIIMIVILIITTSEVPLSYFAETTMSGPLCMSIRQGSQLKRRSLK